MSNKITSIKNSVAACEIRTASFTLLTLFLRSTDLSSIQEILSRKATPGLFENEPTVIDISGLELTHTTWSSSHLSDLRNLMTQHGLNLLGARGLDEQASWAQKMGLVWLGSSTPAPAAVETPAAAAPQATQPQPTAPQPTQTELSLPQPSLPKPSAMVIDKPLRSGQQVYARGCDLIVMAAVNFGAEVIADGNIHVYAPLRGRAIAGAKGDTQARIFAMMMEPQLISIAGTYRTFDAPLPPDIHAKAAYVRLEGDSLHLQAIEP